MKIVCKIHRENGTRVTFNDGTAYHFKPDADGDHVCDVQNKDHIAAFLRITEGYKRKGEADLIVTDTSDEEEAEKAAYPLAGVDVGALSNKELSALAKEALGIRGTNKADIAVYARNFLGTPDLVALMPKASYIDLLRHVMSRVADAQREELRMENLKHEVPSRP